MVRHVQPQSPRSSRILERQARRRHCLAMARPLCPASGIAEPPPVVCCRRRVPCSGGSVPSARVLSVLRRRWAGGRAGRPLPLRGPAVSSARRAEPALGRGCPAPLQTRWLVRSCSKYVSSAESLRLGAEEAEVHVVVSGSWEERFSTVWNSRQEVLELRLRRRLSVLSPNDKRRQRGKQTGGIEVEK